MGEKFLVGVLGVYLSGERGSETTVFLWFVFSISSYAMQNLCSIHFLLVSVSIICPLPTNTSLTRNWKICFNPEHIISESLFSFCAHLASGSISSPNKFKLSDHRIQIHHHAAFKSPNKKSLHEGLVYFLDHLDLVGVTKTRFVFTHYFLISCEMISRSDDCSAWLNCWLGLRIWNRKEISNQERCLYLSF